MQPTTCKKEQQVGYAGESDLEAVCELIFVSPHVRHDMGSLKLLLENKLVGVTASVTIFGVVASPIVRASHRSQPLLLSNELL